MAGDYCPLQRDPEDGGNLPSVQLAHRGAGMSLPIRVWICRCCDDRCIVLRDTPPEDVCCRDLSIFPIPWVAANAVQLEPVALIEIAASLSEASSHVMAEAAASLRGPGL